MSVGSHSQAAGATAAMTNALVSAARRISNVGFTVTELLSGVHYGIPESSLSPGSRRELLAVLDAVGYGAADMLSRGAFGAAWASVKGVDLVREAALARNFGDIAGRFFKRPEQRLGFRFEDVCCCDHRSGWNYVMYLLQKEFTVPHGPLFVDFAERVWGWQLVREDRVIEYGGCTHRVPYGSLRAMRHMTVAPIGGGGDGEGGGDEMVLGWTASTGAWRLVKNVRPGDIEHLPIPGVIREPFVTVFHNPPGMPPWFDADFASPQAILAKPEFLESLPNCRGVFAFSRHLADWLRERLPASVPVSVVRHPTESVPDAYRWSASDFALSKTVVQVGWWLRRLRSIFRLNADGYKKVWLHGGDRAFELLATEMENAPTTAASSTDLVLAEREGGDHPANGEVDVMRLDNYGYDELLRRSVALVDLYDSSCNNAILECIARRTPVFVRRMPATVEYLGEDYPLLFDDLREVEDALAHVRETGDMSALVAASEALGAIHASGAYSAEAFEAAVRGSEVFKAATMFSGRTM